MSAHRDKLAAAVDRLEKDLARPASGDERDWNRHLDQTLAFLGEAVRRHAAALAASKGKPADVDRPLIPSPGVSRRLEELQQELEGFLGETTALRRKVQGLVPPPDGAGRPETLAGALSVAPQLGAVADFGVFCERARALLAALQHYEEEEAALVLESVNTDIGAGD